MRHDEIVWIIDNAYEDARLLAGQKQLKQMSFDMIHICCQTLLIMGTRSDVDLENICVRINSLCIDYIWSYLETPEHQKLALIRSEIKNILEDLDSL